MTVDKEKALQEWASTNPFLTDRLMFDYLGGHDGNCSISPMFSDAIIKAYINGDRIREYPFALQVMFAVSDTTDNVNTDNMFTLRQWQDWINGQEAEKNYPDFGDDCMIYQLENLNNMPAMAMRYENNMAKYQFFAKFTYYERMAK